MESISFNSRRANVVPRARIKEPREYRLDKMCETPSYKFVHWRPINPEIKASDLSMQNVKDHNMEAFMRPIRKADTHSVFEKVDAANKRLDSLSASRKAAARSSKPVPSSVDPAPVSSPSVDVQS